MKPYKDLTIFLTLLVLLLGLLAWVYIGYQVHTFLKEAKAADYKIDIIKEPYGQDNGKIEGSVNDTRRNRQNIGTQSRGNGENGRDSKSYRKEMATVTAYSELEVKSYVLNEVKKAGLDPIFVEKLIDCESGWNTKAVSSDGENKGLWQTNIVHKIGDACKFDYKCSTAWAIKKRLHEGHFNAWSCKRTLNRQGIYEAILR